MVTCWNLVEFAGDVEALAPRSEAGERWLALTPTAMEDLEQKGVPYVVDGDVCPADDLNRIGQANFARAEALADAYDRAVFDWCPEIRRLELPPFRGHFSRVKFLLDAITIRLHILRSLTPDEQPRFRKTRPRGSRPEADGNLFYPAHTSLYADLLDLLENGAQATVDWVPRAPVPPVHPRNRPRAVLRHLKEMSRRSRLSLLVARNGSTRPRRILVLSRGYDLGHVAEACRAEGSEIFYLDLSRLRLFRFPGWWPCRIRQPSEKARAISGVLQQLSLFGPDDPAEALCQGDGISYAPLVRNALERYLRHSFPRAIAVREFLEECRREYGIDLVLSPYGPYAIDITAVFDFCRAAGIPVAVVQHGSYGYVDNPITNYYEFGFDGDFLAWGPGVEAHYGDTKRGRVRFVPVGSPTLDALLARRPRTATSRRRVMYVITDFRGYSAYFPGGQPWLDTRYYQFQRQVLNVLERYQDTYDVWLKVPPGMDQNGLAQNPIRQWLRERGARIRVEDRPLLDVISRPALFLIDFPSTTLPQCLATRAQVVVFTGAPHFRVLDDARRLLEKRAVCCDSEAEFLETTDAILRQGLTPESEEPDDAFLSMYGTLRNDGGSLARIMAHLTMTSQGGGRG